MDDKQLKIKNPNTGKMVKIGGSIVAHKSLTIPKCFPM
jgi:hypothetical protein